MSNWEITYTMDGPVLTPGGYYFYYRTITASTKDEALKQLYTDVPGAFVLTIIKQERNTNE